MKPLLLILLGLVISLPGNGQSVLMKTDSLITAARYDDALRLIDQALQKNKDQKTATLLNNKAAEILMTQGRLTDAEKRLTAIKAGEDQFLNAITRTNLGFLDLTRARNDRALENLQQALMLFQQTGKQATREGARCQAYLALVYVNTGKYNQARETGLVALQIRQQLFPETSEEVAASYNDLGLVFEQEDPEKALVYYQKALGIYEKLFGARHPKIAQAKSNIGFTYNKLKQYGDAIDNFETAEAILKENYPGGHPSQAFAEVNLGLSYLKLNDKKSALVFLEQALAVYHKSYGQKHSDIASVYNQIGLIRLTEDQYEEALKNFQAAICANVPDFGSTDFKVTPKVGQYFNGKVLLFSLRLKAQGLEALYAGKTLKFDHLRHALNALHSCDTLIDNIRHHSTDEDDKIELGELANETYEDGVRIAMAMSEVSLYAQRYLQAAFYFAEKSKSAVLQESIADAEAKSYAGIPQDEVEREKNLKAALTLLNQRLSQSGPEQAVAIRAELNTLNREYELFVKKLESDYPKYYNLKFNTRLPEVSDLQNILSNQQAVVSYFVAEKGKRLYQFVITKQKFSVRTAALPDNFDRYSKGFTKSILFDDLDTYRKSTELLAQILLPTVPASISELIIIPSGRLGTIPFEALPYKKFTTTEFKKIPYLVQRFAISYEFSAALLAQKSKTGPSSDNPSIFLCAPVTFPELTRLSGLPGTEKEVNRIAGLFGPSSSTVFTLKDASEVMAKSGTLSKYQYLHFATHGLVDEVNPELSRIFLNGGSGEDGNLYAGEIYSLDLHADLAVLSACQTGLGKVSKGEGVIGLSRALVYAGARTIVVSLWSVADESTSLLMTDFYSIMLKNKQQNFRQNLRAAKLDMIQQGTYASPYYWAPFVMIGY